MPVVGVLAEDQHPGVSVGGEMERSEHFFLGWIHRGPLPFVRDERL